MGERKGRGEKAVTACRARLTLAISLTLFLTLLPYTAHSENLLGFAQVIDGDTLEVSGKRVRIYGIDAPEGRQTCRKNQLEWLCGQEAGKALRELIEGARVTCETMDRDRYGRIVGRCIASDIDIGEQMVRNGLALAYRRYSTAYVQAEASAKASRVGIWAGEFVAPWEWRRGTRLKAEAVNDNEECLIKGNIGRSGDRIYHIPGGQYYSRTKIDPTKGERYFCSEGDAQTAGWRKSRR